MGKREELIIFMVVASWLVFMVHIANGDIVVCGVDVEKLAPCQNAVSNKLRARPPTKECCTALSKIPVAKMKCFCKYMTSPLLPRIGVDPHKGGFSFCEMSQDGLMSCKTAVTKPNPAEPTAGCCEALSGANLTCLCSYRNSLVLPSLGIDPVLAMGLPAKCKNPTPANC
ncbi:hypothetical protein Dimus_016953 [Dionaea muscipula]